MNTIEEQAIMKGSCWDLLNGVDPVSRFKEFGAVEVHPTQDPLSSAWRTFMVMTKDGRWWYAHNDGSSVYVGCKEHYNGKTAAQALAHRVLRYWSHKVSADYDMLKKDTMQWDKALRDARALHLRDFNHEGNPIL